MLTGRVVSRANRALLQRQWRRLQSNDSQVLQRTLQHSIAETQAATPQYSPFAPRTAQNQDVVPVKSAEVDVAQLDNRMSGAEEFLDLQRRRQRSSYIGAAVAPHYRPRDLVNKPPTPEQVSLESLLASQSHLGHATSLWHPGNSQYIFGIRDGIHIISLEATAAHLRRAAKIVSAVSEKGGLILFVGTRAGQDRAVVKAAKIAGGCHVFEKWIPGTITNGNQLLARCKMKVVDEFDRALPGYQEQLQERAALKPDLVVCLNPLENYILLHECRSNHIPTIGIVDTDCNPTWVTYPIPANDDSLRCTQFIAGVLGTAGAQGRARRLAAADGGVVTYKPAEGLKAPVRRRRDGDESEDRDFYFWKGSQQVISGPPKA